MRINASGIETTSGQVDLDLIVFATGFDLCKSIKAFRQEGREGKVLGDLWGEYPEAHKGVSYPGFPNHFLIFGPSSGLVYNSSVL